MTDAWASDVAVDETTGAPAPVEAGARLQSGAIVGIFVLLVLYFLYFASPILIPDHHGVAPEHAIGTHCTPARLDSRAAYFGLFDRRGGGRRSIVWYCGEPQRPGSELAD